MEMQFKKATTKSLAYKVWNRANRQHPDDCWEWMGHIGRTGYGILKHEGRPQLAHRLVFQLAGRDLPPDMCACHTCDNRKCINPNHLFVGSSTDNNRDRDSKGRQAKGERGGRAKLTEKQVIEIRQRQSNGEKIASLSREFGVSWAAIKFVVNGTNWRCV